MNKKETEKAAERDPFVQAIKSLGGTVILMSEEEDETRTITINKGE